MRLYLCSSPRRLCREQSNQVCLADKRARLLLLLRLIPFEPKSIVVSAGAEHPDSQLVREPSHLAAGSSQTQRASSRSSSRYCCVDECSISRAAFLRGLRDKEPHLERSICVPRHHIPRWDPAAVQTHWPAR